MKDRNIQTNNHDANPSFSHPCAQFHSSTQPIQLLPSDINIEHLCFIDYLTIHASLYLPITYVFIYHQRGSSVTYRQQTVFTGWLGSSNSEKKNPNFSYCS
eukprot:TRINITY_DN1828_c0_g1_i18.p1 TRINITY_DN1828_c0_g1~~TRINITY_DN1828_c0_g1_i18.p1  ORF type:complete len:101 (+),score=8.59 TRINITY_DN1828_c0_g1_i18:118-420(+)